jgi:hypothetical protein
MGAKRREEAGMSERETESGEERIDAEGRNPTQQRMDEEGVQEAPVDASWSGQDEEQAGANEPIFEPDVPLEAEVNREAPPRSRKGLIAAVVGAAGVVGAFVLRRRRR